MIYMHVYILFRMSILACLTGTPVCWLCCDHREGRGSERALSPGLLAERTPPLFWQSTACVYPKAWWDWRRPLCGAVGIAPWIDVPLLVEQHWTKMGSYIIMCM